MCVSVCVYVPEFVLERVLCAYVGLSFSSWSPAARQVFGVPGPAGQIDRLLWRHWDSERRKHRVMGGKDRVRKMVEGWEQVDRAGEGEE